MPYHNNIVSKMMPTSATVQRGGIFGMKVWTAGGAISPGQPLVHWATATDKTKIWVRTLTYGDSVPGSTALSTSAAKKVLGVSMTTFIVDGANRSGIATIGGYVPLLNVTGAVALGNGLMLAHGSTGKAEATTVVGGKDIFAIALEATGATGSVAAFVFPWRF